MAEAQRQREKTATQAAADALEQAKKQAERLMSVQPVKIARNVPVAHLTEDAMRRAVNEARGTVHHAEEVDRSLGFQVFHQRPVEVPPQLVKELVQLKEVGIKAARGDAQAKTDFEKLRKQYSHDLAAFLSNDADKRVSDPAENLRKELNQKHEIVAEFRKELRESGIVDMIAPERSQGYWLYRRLGRIGNEIEAIRDNIGKPGFEKRVEELSADYKQLMELYHPAKLALAELKKGGALESYLKESESADHSLNKVYALTDLESSTTHLMESLRIMQYSPEDMAKARKEFVSAVEDKAQALARLVINENTLAENVMAAGDLHNDPTKRFAFYKDALIASYDASTHGKGFDKNLESVSAAVMQLEVCMAISDKKLFASGEAKLQQNVISNSEKLVANFSSQLAGGKATISDVEAVSAAAKSDSDALYAKIKRARRIDQLAELGASLIPVIGPAFMTASVVKGAAHDYAETGEISPMTGVMAATALIGLRGGVAREAFAAIEKSATLKLAEIGIAGAMTVPQVSLMAESWANYYIAPKAEKTNRQDALEEAIFNSITLTMPLIAGAAHRKVSKMLDARETFAPENRPESAREAPATNVATPEIEIKASPHPEETTPSIHDEARASKGSAEGPPRPSQVVEEGVASERPAPTPSEAPAREESPRTSRGVDRFLELTPQRQDRFIRLLRSKGQHESANFLTEVRGLPDLERSLGVPEGSLTSIYREAPDIMEARKQTLVVLEGSGAVQFGLKPVLDKIKVVASREIVDMGELELLHKQLNDSSTIVAEKSDLFGLLLSGNLLQNIQTIAPGTKVTAIKRYGGLVGVYRVNLDNGKSLYVVPQDANPHMAGAIASRIAGVPSPGALAKVMGRDLEYVDSDGFRHKYGVSPDIKDFSGTLPVYERKVQVSTSAAADFEDSLRRAEVYKFVKEKLDAGQHISTMQLMAEITQKNPSLAKLYEKNPRVLGGDLRALQENPMLYKTVSENPALVWREFGFAQTAFMNAGSFDGHENNSWMMMLRVSETDATYLEGKGYSIFRDAEGKPQILRIGRIDTDTFGYFLATLHTDGHYDYGALQARYGAEDVRRVVEIAAAIQNQPAQTISNDAYAHMMEGAGKWSREVGSNPEFSRNIRLLYTGRNGMAVGIGETLDPASKERVRKAIQEGVPPIVSYQLDPFNGKPGAPITDIYGRSTLNAADFNSTFNDFFSKGIPDEFKSVWKGIQAETNHVLVQKKIQAQAQGEAR